MARALLVLALTCGLAGRALAHEHMYIASTKTHGGALVLDYDFGRQFPLAELPSKPGTWIGVDPSFNSIVDDDPARSLFRLKNGTRVVMEITAIDRAVSVDLGGKTLRAAGDRTRVGTMPYLHVHPEWTLTLPVGAAGTGQISFRVRASGYAPSPVYTGTLSAVPAATTTTTTLEGATTTTTGPCTPDSCNDQDPCTTDVCDGTACRYDPVAGADAVLCRLQKFGSVLDHMEPTDRAGRRALAMLYDGVGKGRVAVQAARTQGTPRRFKKAARLVSRLTSRVDVVDRKGVFDAAAVSQLKDLASTAYDAFALWAQASGAGVTPP